MATGTSAAGASEAEGGPVTGEESITTYHCICAEVVLATTTPTLESLPRRAEPAKDRARILPLRAFPSSSTSSSSSLTTPNNNNNSDDSPASSSKGKLSIQASANNSNNNNSYYPLTELVGLRQDPVPVMVQRDDGYEKRWTWRCQRCACLLGYALRDNVVAAAAAASTATGVGGDGPLVIYLLEEGLRSSEVLEAKSKAT